MEYPGAELKCYKLLNVWEKGLNFNCDHKLYRSLKKKKIAWFWYSSNTGSQYFQTFILSIISSSYNHILHLF